MLETISISASAAAIFSAEEGWGRPWPKRKDIFWDVWCVGVFGEGACVGALWWFGLRVLGCCGLMVWCWYGNGCARSLAGDGADFLSLDQVGSAYIY
jgi:hypothetical protein